MVVTAGVVTGTIAGRRLFQMLPEPVFRRTVSGIILALGTAMLLGLGR